MEFDNILVELKAMAFRLDSASRKLWDEDKAAAVPVEAVAVELKTAIDRVEKAFAEFNRAVKGGAEAAARAEEARDSAVRALESELKLERTKAATLQEELRVAAAGFERDMKAVNGRCDVMKEEVHSLTARLETALREAAQLEDQLVAAKEAHLKAEAQKDADRSRRMDELVAGMGEKERALEEAWSRRHKELEDHHRAMVEELRAGAERMEKVYAQKEARLMELNKRLIDEFQDREGRARAMEEDLRAHTALAASASAELQREYERLRAGLEEERKKILAEAAAAQGK